MEKKKFSWELFTKIGSNIIVRDTKENEKIFLQIAEKQGIEVDWKSFNEAVAGSYCYFSISQGNLITMSTIFAHTEDEIYTLEEVMEGIGLNRVIKLEDGDMVQIRKRSICVIINGYILDFNKKEIVSKVKEYDLSLNDRDNLRSLDIIKVAKKDTLVPYNYIVPSEEYIEFDIPTIISVGRLDKNKNHKLLIESCCKLKEKIKEFQVVIIGEGEEREELEKLIRELNVEKYVKLYG